jgi:hypothetical protein
VRLDKFIAPAIRQGGLGLVIFSPWDACRSKSLSGKLFAFFHLSALIDSAAAAFFLPRTLIGSFCHRPQQCEKLRSHVSKVRAVAWKNTFA